MTSTSNINESFRVGQKDVIYQYQGEWQNENLDDILITFEDILNNKVTAKVVRRKLFNLAIELTQNTFNYIKTLGLNYKSAIFTVLHDSNGSYKLSTTNYIHTNDISSVRSRIEMVNALDELELDELYRGVLEIGSSSKSGGAGLGFIQLVRKSGCKLNYKFSTVTDGFSRFTLEVTFPFFN